MPATPPVDAQLLRSGLVGDGSPWLRVDCVPATGSTNADLAERARSGEPAGAVLVSEYQRVGRGRLERGWEAPPGTSVAISVLLRPAAHVSKWSWLPLVAGMAVVDALTGCAGVEARVKWPNDVLIDERKVCGILSEVVSTRPPACVIGLGVNISLDAAELPVPTATSLLLAGSTTEKTRVVAAILTELGRWLARWESGQDLRFAYAQRCGTIGRDVRVIVDADTFVQGRAVGVDEDGRLVVATDSGPRAFAAGDVLHLR